MIFSKNLPSRSDVFFPSFSGAVVDPDLLKFQQKQKKSGWESQLRTAVNTGGVFFTGNDSSSSGQHSLVSNESPENDRVPSKTLEFTTIGIPQPKGRSGKGNKIYSMDRGRYVKASLLFMAF